MEYVVITRHTNEIQHMVNTYSEQGFRVIQQSTVMRNHSGNIYVTITMEKPSE